MSTPPLLTDTPEALKALARAKVLYTDLDGTLLAQGGCVLADANGAPSTRVAEAVVSLNLAGLEVVPVSGRSRTQLIEVVRLLGWSSFIAEAGAVVQHGVGAGAQVSFGYGEWGPDAANADVTPYEAIERSGAAEALARAFPGRIEYHDPWHRDREATHLLRGCLDVAEAQSVLDSIEPAIDIVDNGIVRNPGDLTCEGPPHAYHLVPRGVSKAAAISIDLARRGLTSSDAAAIGDSATDLAMGEAVGVMVLVANAFDSSGVTAELAARPRGNVYRTAGARGDGWAEFAQAWLAAH